MNRLIYSNSCSFGAPQEHPVYSEIIAKTMSYDIVNNGVHGSCNRRIIRTSLRSLIELQTQGYTEITALIGLTFIHRTELWQPHLTANGNDGDFHSVTNQTIQKLNWSQGQTDAGHSDVYKYADAEVKEYYKQWLTHFSKEAEVANLLADIIMLNGYAVANNIKILFFCNCCRLPGLPDVDCSAPFLSGLVNYVKHNKSMLDFWEFSFADFARNRGYKPKDENLYGVHGHPPVSAHEDFAKFLIEILAKLN